MQHSEIKVLVRRYNPITMKPTSLEPYVQYGIPLYWGPDPSAGTSYGFYVNKHKTPFVSVKKDSVYCPITGEKMNFIFDFNDMKFISESKIKEEKSCLSCNENVFSNFVVSEKYACWNCGHLLKGDNKTMSKLREIRKSIDKKISSASEKSILDDGEFVSIDELLEDLEKNKEVKADTTEDVKEEIKEEIKEEMIEEAKEEATEEIAEEIKEEIKENISEEIKEEISEEATEDIKEEIKEEMIEEAKEEASEEIKEEIKEEMIEEVSEEVKDHIEETVEELNEANEEKSKEEMIDLDIVLSQLHSESEMIDLEEIISEAKLNLELEVKMKTEKEKTIAKLREKAMAKRRAMAESEVPTLEELVSPKEEIVEEVKEEVKEEKVEEIVEEIIEEKIEEALEEKVEEMIEEKIEEALEEKKEEISEALRYETLASLEEVKMCSEENIEMVLFGERTNNPYWVIFVNQKPLAKIECNKQENCEDIKEVFVSDIYASDFVKHCSNIGIVECLKGANADFYCNETSDAKVAAKFEAQAQAQVAKAKSQIQEQVKSDFIKALDVVTVGMNKNLYADVGHPLKDALFEGMVIAGLPEATAKSIVNASFMSASSQYYQAVFEKTIAFMNLSEMAQSEVKQMISDSAVADASSEEMTLSERLSVASSVASIRPFNLEVKPSIEIDKNLFKARLKSTMKI